VATAAALDLLRDLQALLGAVHAIEPPADVRDYVLTDAAVLAQLTDGRPGRDTDEKLVVVEGGDGLDVALYLEAAVLDRLADQDPRRALCGTNLADFWTAVEGVSHFNYLVWNAARDRPVTLLELEVQGEVDKYTATRALLAAQPGGGVGGPVHARLFDDTRLADALSAEEAARYRDAASLAGRYCKRLEARFAPGGLPVGLVRELRAFFRLPQGPKVTRIRAAQLDG
jgi:hypothetical protein